MMSGNDKLSIPQAEPRGITELLDEALAMTERVATGGLSTEEVTQVIDERARLVERVTELRHSGAEWTDRETRLVARLQAADEQLIAKMWEQRKDSFDWLAARAPQAVEDMPLLRGLASR